MNNELKLVLIEQSAASATGTHRAAGPRGARSCCASEQNVGRWNAGARRERVRALRTAEQSEWRSRSGTAGCASGSENEDALVGWRQQRSWPSWRLTLHRDGQSRRIGGRRQEGRVRSTRDFIPSALLLLCRDYFIQNFLNSLIY